jgi:hypothetical protein
MHRRVMAGVMNLTFLVSMPFFSPGALRASPRLAKPQHFNRGSPFQTPHLLYSCTCDQPALPGSEAIKSKREWGGAAGARYLHLGRTTHWRFISRGPGDRLAWSRRATVCTVAVGVANPDSDSFTFISGGQI